MARTSALHLVPPSGERGDADRSVDHALPEPPQRRRGVARAGEGLAVSTHQGSKIADARREQRFNPLAQAPREHGRIAAGADRDHHVAAIDHGRNEKGRQVGPVDHVDRHIAGAGAGSDLLIERSAGRRDHGDEFREVGLERIGQGDFQMTGRRAREQHLLATSMSPAYQRTCAPAERRSRNLLFAAAPPPTRATTPADRSRNTGKKRIGTILTNENSFLYRYELSMPNRKIFCHEEQPRRQDRLADRRN
jgi:hypothetical protein